MSRMIQVKTPDGSFAAYVAYPASTARAAVIVVQEIFGINADMRLTCDELARQGYVGVCPDLFWRLEPNVELTDRTEAEWARGLRLYKALNIAKGLEDITAAAAAARDMVLPGGRVGLMGYCMGGLMTFLTATQLHLDAAVAYYPGGAEEHLEHAADVAGPLLIHLAGDDEYMPKQAQRSIREALQGKPNVEIYSYPGCRHAFARHSGIHFDAVAAGLANARTADFLKLHLLED